LKRGRRGAFKDLYANSNTHTQTHIGKTGTNFQGH